MTYKYNVKGVGLDQIFDPYISGTKASLTGYTVKISGVDTDLRDIFAPLYLGTSAGPTNYKVKNADLNTFFAAKGTANYSLPINGQTYNSQSSGNVSSSMLASAKITIKADGTYAVQCVGNNIVTSPASGTWLPSGGTVSNFQVQFTSAQVSQFTTGPATITNTAAAFTACTSDQSLTASAASPQTGGQDRGGTYAITIAIKNVATGSVATTTITFTVESVGTA